VKVADLESYLRKIENEYKELVAGVFWKEYVAAVLDLRRKASKNCETYEDVKKWQGEIHGYDSVLSLPDKIIDIVREKRATEQSNR
jgi:hypothetical protein